jgi:hypothetical protein
MSGDQGGAAQTRVKIRASKAPRAHMPICARELFAEGGQDAVTYIQLAGSGHPPDALPALAEP